MKANQKDRQAAADKILHLNFTLLMYKLEKSSIFSLIQIQNMCEKYKKFLYLVYIHRGVHRLAPTREIDLIWHSHILDTRQYIKDCNDIFGEYLHHYPYSGIDGVTSEDEQTKRHHILDQLYEEEYGEALESEKLSFLQKIIFSCM